MHCSRLGRAGSGSETGIQGGGVRSYEDWFLAGRNVPAHIIYCAIDRKRNYQEGVLWVCINVITPHAGRR